MTDTVQRDTEITAVEDLPVIRMVRDFDASPEQLLLAHTDPELFVRWIGPDSITTTLDSWDCRTGGSWAYTSRRDDLTISFFGSFHEIRPDRLVQTFTWDGNADQVSLETMTFQTIGDGRTRLEAISLHGSFAARDGMLSSGMDVGVNEGYRKLDGLLAGGSR